MPGAANQPKPMLDGLINARSQRRVGIYSSDARTLAVRDAPVPWGESWCQPVGIGSWGKRATIRTDRNYQYATLIIHTSNDIGCAAVVFR